jgi:hypothetical protein
MCDASDCSRWDVSSIANLSAIIKNINYARIMKQVYSNSMSILTTFDISEDNWHFLTIAQPGILAENS